MNWSPPWKRAIPHNHDLYILLGLDPKKHLPSEGLEPKMVNGVEVYVKPKSAMPPNKRKHRVFAICPDCSKHVPAGRLFQHKCPPPEPTAQFELAQRVELHPATDQWMSGDRWGTIIRKSKSSLMLRMDVSGRRIVVRPEHLKDFALPF